MGTLTREALLGASDLIEKDVELPSIGGSVRIRSLPAAYSNEATSEALEMTTDQRGRQTSRVNTVKLEALKVRHALVDPKLTSLEDAFTLSKQIGPAWQKLIEEIDRISGITVERSEQIQATFQSGSPGETGDPGSNGTRSGGERPDLSVRTGA